MIWRANSSSGCFTSVPSTASVDLRLGEDILGEVQRPSTTRAARADETERLPAAAHETADRAHVRFLHRLQQQLVRAALSSAAAGTRK